IYENAPIELRLGWPDDGPNGAGSVDGTRALGNGMDGDNPILPDNLVCVNVQPAWDQDLKGQGRLVADFDTGADGNHPAFASRWRGAQPGVDWSWAWKDPYTNTQFPYDHAIHGTHTLGIMVGEKPDGTPIGVAPGAEWIAAGILIDYNVQLIIECYQWAIDPDGDPSTIVDVPDVINNSWGTSGNCDPTYWGAIDVVEAAGIVNTIAVDNTGPSPGSVNSPESRCDTPNVNWGVGNVNPHIEGYPIASSSGRGPSPCDGVSIKPEVTAPGTQIYSTLPGNSYGNLSGTSMACPHTSGAVAILRQVNPDLTVDEVKTALMATAVDKGTAGEDNDYGWGIIDIGAAVAYVQQTLPALPPRNLVALADSNDVHLSWERPESLDPGNPLQQYRIYRAAAGDSFPPDPIAEVGVLAAFPSYDDLDLSAGQYRYVVTAVYARGESGPSNEADVAIDASSSVADLGAAAASLVLGVSPNPFQPRTVIRYRALGTSPIALAVYDPSGKRVRVLAEGRSGDANAGGVERGASVSLVWDGTDDAGRRLASGVYFVKLEQAGVARTERVSLLK
ncbi:MAG: S8 family serine peptidase, partial [Candidatus Eisenbacteria bacterium]|nr:S8 family serine peptidase [Candidatus Eisenbacteria bacterium]